MVCTGGSCISPLIQRWRADRKLSSVFFAKLVPTRLTLQDCSAYSPFRGPTPPSDHLKQVGVFETAGARRFKDRFQFMARGNFGERLKRERELREVSMDELTKATRISA